MTFPSPSPVSEFTTARAALAVTLTPVVVGCESTAATAGDVPEIAELVISPDRAFVPVGTQVDFAVAALTAESHTGSEVKIDWTPTDTAVFTVE